MKKHLLCLMLIISCIFLVACGDEDEDDSKKGERNNKEEVTETVGKTDESDITVTTGDATTEDLYEEINPFDYVTVSYEGISPFATATYAITDKTKPYTKFIQYSLSADEDLKVGDVITLTAQITDSISEEYLIKLSETSKEYIVSEVSYYANSLEEIPQDVMDKMIAETKDMIVAHTARGFNHKLDECEFVGNYMLTLKEGKNNSRYNEVFCIFELTQSNSDDPSDGGYKTFVYVGYYPIYFLADGTCVVDYNNTDSPSQTNWDFSVNGAYLFGLKDMDEFLNKAIYSEVDMYTYSTNISQ